MINDKEWGRYGNKPPCEHLIALRNFLAKTGLAIWSEHGEQPAGWVNVSCPHCHRTYETELHDDRARLPPLPQ